MVLWAIGIGYFVHYVTVCLWVKDIYDALELEYGLLTIAKQENKKRMV